MPTTSAIRPILVRLLLLALLFSSSPREGWAVEASGDITASRNTVTPEMLQDKIKETEKTALLDDATKSTLLGLYRQSLTNLETAAGYDAVADKFAFSGGTARAEIAKIKEEMGRLKAGVGSLPDSLPLKDIEQRIATATSDYAATEENISDLNRRYGEQGERPTKAMQRLSQIKEVESALTDSRESKSSSAETPWIVEARGWLKQTQSQALRSEARMLNQELLSLPALMDLTTAQREVASARLEATRNLMQHLEAMANRKRQDEATASIGQAKEAMLQTADSLPVLQVAASVNSNLSHDLQTMITSLEELGAEKDAIDHELKNLEDGFRIVKRKLELAGVSQSVGFLLHEQRRTIVNVRLLRKKIDGFDEVIAKAGLLRMHHEEEWTRLKDMDSYVAKLTSGSSPEEVRKVEPELRALLDSRRELLEKIISFGQTHFSKLSELEISYHQYLHTVESYNSFLAERLLWVRSTPMMGIGDFMTLPAEVASFFASNQWSSDFRTLLRNPGSWPFVILSCAVFGALMRGKKRLLTCLEQTVELAANPATYRFGLPLRALGVTILLALSWPLPIFATGWELQNLPNSSSFAQIAGSGLVIFSLRFFLLAALRTLCLPKGLGAGFFQWPAESMRLVRRELGTLIYAMLPLMLLGRIAIYGDYYSSGNETFGRLALIAGLCLLASFFHRFLHPGHGVWSHYLAANPKRITSRLYPFLFSLAVLFPVVMSGLVFFGYVFSVSTLMICLFNSLWVASGLLVCHQLVRRGLTMSGRGGSPEDGAASGASGSYKLLNVAVTAALLVGLWLVWEEVFPALRVLNEFTLWSYTAAEGGETVTVPVTLGSLGLAALIGFVTWAAARHLPSIVHVVLREQLNVSPGALYTVTTLSGYVISVVGGIMVVSILGFKWSQIQWLVAALGVGIGFGLQEIVANFISGLIILFERPIRVGDIVTVGNTDGMVTRIRIRATTIRDFDRKELLVPNKEFISGQLLNWSLSDPVTRIIVPVGIAYGSDVQAAMDLMELAARQNAMVLEDPAPLVTFESFGDDSLRLNLRCFVGSVNDRLPAISALHMDIERKFREARISIAFPQRDVHIDAVRPLEIRVSRESRPQDEAAKGRG
jgi:potassium efflux system protein